MQTIGLVFNLYEDIRNNCLDLITEKFPAFQSILKSYKSEYDEESLGITLFGGMAKFSDYVSNLMIQNEHNSSEINEIFSYMEFLLVNGDENVQNAVATCFLENILNKTPEQINPKRFVKYLGPKSQARPL